MWLGQALDIHSGRAWNEFDHARKVEHGFETVLLSHVLAPAQPGTTFILTLVTSPQGVCTADWKFLRI